MRKLLGLIVGIVVLFTASQCLAKTQGATILSRSEICTVNISGDWMRTVGKIKISAMNKLGKVKQGKIKVHIYDEVNVKMKTITVTGSKIITLPKKHKFYTLKFENTFKPSNYRYYDSVRWRVDAVRGGNVRIE